MKRLIQMTVLSVGLAFAIVAASTNGASSARAAGPGADSDAKSSQTAQCTALTNAANA